MLELSLYLALHLQPCHTVYEIHNHLQHETQSYPNNQCNLLFCFFLFFSFLSFYIILFFFLFIFSFYHYFISYAYLPRCPFSIIALWSIKSRGKHSLSCIQRMQYKSKHHQWCDSSTLDEILRKARNDAHGDAGIMRAERNFASLSSWTCMHTHLSFFFLLSFSLIVVSFNLKKIICE